MHNILRFLSVVLSIFFSCLTAFADAPATQTAGAVDKSLSDSDLSKKLKKTIETPRKKVAAEDTTVIGEDVSSGEKVLIKKIIVEDSKLLTQAQISAVTTNYENKALSIAGMQKIADLISDLYRAKGYPTSRAYVPAQTIKKDGILIIRVIEGKVGKIEIKGNKFFRSSIYKKKLNLKTGEQFNYSDFQNSLTLINEKPDRFAKAVLMPGSEQGSTDIVLDVQDRLPLHAGYTYDNYGSRYVGRLRQSFFASHNNLFGFDDQFYFKYQRAHANLMESESGRYLLPITNKLDWGLSLSYTRTRLGREFYELKSIGKAVTAGMFLNYNLISTVSTDLRLNLAFDYKRVRNTILGVDISRDDGRVVRAGFDYDCTDSLGRTLLTAEVDQGVPMWNGLRTKDTRATRIGSGGKFTKGVFNLYRSQPMPFSSNLLVKNSAQITRHTLTSTEAFQIGGPYSVRGYSPAEYAGDKGLYSAAEWSFPYYFIPKNAMVPFLKANIYDSSRFVLFYDWATVHQNNVQADEEKHSTINSIGFGTNFNFNYISMKFEVAYPIHNPVSSDTAHQHLQPWLEMTVEF